MFSSSCPRKKFDSPFTLQLETLESRMMLSTVSIFAAGQTGAENLDLFIDGQFATTFNNVGGDVGSRDFVELQFDTDETLSPGRIGIAFGNDFFDPQTGEDRNLLVDRIVVDGVSVETEDPSTRSTGIFRNGITGPGNFETELININAIFTFADPVGQGDRVEFDALGTTGDEVVELVIGDQVVSSFQLGDAGATGTFSFSSSSSVSLEDVEVRFVNDLFDPANGIDRNAQIFEFRVVDGETGGVSTARTTDANVLSSGIFVPGEGITTGFGAGGFLATNGSVQIVNGGSNLTATIDPDFQSNTFVSSIETAVGSNNQVATLGPSGDLILVDDAGNLVSSFGDNGFVNVEDLLGGRVPALADGRAFFTDLEFFNDGSILVTGAVAPTQGSNGNVLSDPIIAKINPDGSLDRSFSQQGVVQGTFLQLFGFNNDLKSVIDNDGRVILFGANTTSAAGNNYAVSRLNSDGTLDSTFGNGGNAFVAIGGTNLPADIKITTGNQLVFGVVSPFSISLGRLNENGSQDFTFGNGGLATVTPTSTNTLSEFLLDSQDRIVIASDPVVLAVNRLTANGQVDSSFGDNGFTLLAPDDSIGAQGVANDPPFRLFLGGIAVDSADNVIVAANANGNDGSRPLLLQRVFSNGQIDQGFGVAGTSVLQTSDGIQSGVNQLIFDSEDRLVVGATARGITRIDFV